MQPRRTGETNSSCTSSHYLRQCTVSQTAPVDSKCKLRGVVMTIYKRKTPATFVPNYTLSGSVVQILFQGFSVLPTTPELTSPYVDNHS